MTSNFDADSSTDEKCRVALRDYVEDEKASTEIRKAIIKLCSHTAYDEKLEMLILKSMSAMKKEFQNDANNE